MSWRGSTTVIDRVWAALPYILPIASSSLYAMALMRLLPATEIVVMPIAMLGMAYNMMVSYLGMFGELLIFFGLFMFVVRNPKIGHFIRYNTMQALMISIMISLVNAVFQAVQLSAQIILFQETPDPVGYALLYFFAAVFIVAAAAYGYSLFKVAQGQYAEIKWISDAAYAQTNM
jgi:Chloroplast import apparatus Tic20-like